MTDLETNDQHRMRAAFKALLQGDTAERDRILARMDKYSKDEFLEKTRQAAENSSWRSGICGDLKEQLHALTVRCAERIWQDLGDPSLAPREVANKMFLAEFDRLFMEFRRSSLSETRQ